jgi:hypothetical protein
MQLQGPSVSGSVSLLRYIAHTVSHVWSASRAASWCKQACWIVNVQECTQLARCTCARLPTKDSVDARQLTASCNRGLQKSICLGLRGCQADRATSVTTRACHLVQSRSMAASPVCFHVVTASRYFPVCACSRHVDRLSPYRMRPNQVPSRTDSSNDNLHNAA